MSEGGTPAAEGMRQGGAPLPEIASADGGLGRDALVTDASGEEAGNGRRSAASSAGDLLGLGIYGLANLVALVALLSPLWRPAVGGTPYGASGPLGLSLLVAFCLVALAFEAGSSGLGARAVALLGVLVATNSVLRFAEVALPGPGGFSPIFVLIILAGFAFGARFGFLTGMVSLAVSALITGGVGPWLPYQMISAGWVGLSAGWLPRRPAAGGAAGRGEIRLLAAFGAAWGIGYGLLMTLWFWPYLDGAASDASAPYLRLGTFYLTTALVWDLFRSGGNVLLLAFAGAPVLTALRRFGRQFRFEWEGGAERGDARQGVPGPLAQDQGAAVEAQAAPASSEDLAQARRIHPRAWLAWLAAIVVLAALTRNPLVLGGLALAVAVTRAGLPPAATPVSVMRFSLVVVAFASLYNFLFAHAGTTVVARLPGSWPLLGGPLTLESLVYGAVTGLSLALLFASFAGFQSALSSRDIVRLIPAAFGALALVCTVALGYVPAMLAQWRAVREAQALRGQRWRGLRDAAPLAVPLLVGGIERALDLSDAMRARGLPGSAGPPPAWARAAVLGGVALVAGAWLLRLAGGPPLIAGTGLALGLGAVLAAFLLLGRRRPRTDYRVHRWRAGETLVALAAGAAPALALADPEIRAALAWLPYPTLAWPPMDPRLALALLGPAAPALVGAWRRRPPLGLPEGSARGGAAPPARGPGLAGAAPVHAAIPGPEIAWRGFGFRYPGADAPALAGVDLTLPAGALSLVAGPSGAGKSTLLRSLNGLVPHASGGRVAGQVRVGGLDPTILGPGAMSGKVGWVAGDPERACVMDRVADEVAFALEQRAVPLAEMRARVAAALAQVGLAGMAERPLDTLSGGERQRVQIAAALALAPQLLVLDEPSSQIDDAAAESLMDCLVGLAHAGRTVILAEQRLDRVLPHARRLVHLPGPGLPPRSGSPTELQGSLDRPAAPSPPLPVLGPEVLAIRELTFGYRPERPLFAGLDLALRGGELVALTGPSGSGKTTLLRLAVGLLAPAAGEVRVAGAPIAGRPLAEICRQVAFLPQDPGALLFAETVRAELAATLANHGQAGGTAAEPRIGETLAALGIADLAERHPRDLSTGQRQRVALAALLVTRPPLLLLDEPTRGLDDAAIADLARLLQRLAADGAAALVATHDRRLTGALHRAVDLRDLRLGGRASREAAISGAP